MSWRPNSNKSGRRVIIRCIRFTSCFTQARSIRAKFRPGRSIAIATKPVFLAKMQLFGFADQVGDVYGGGGLFTTLTNHKASPFPRRRGPSRVEILEPPETPVKEARPAPARRRPSSKTGPLSPVNTPPGTRGLRPHSPNSRNQPANPAPLPTSRKALGPAPRRSADAPAKAGGR